MSPVTQGGLAAAAFWPRFLLQQSAAGRAAFGDRLVAANLRRAAHWARRAAERRGLAPAPLDAFESRRFSQNGEDGMLAELFRRLGPGERVAVEFGCGDGAMNCTRRLVEEAGWRAIWLDGGAAEVAAARRALAERPVTVQHRRLTEENLTTALAAAGVPERPDLVVIDVDGNDYRLWRRLAAGYRPRVVVIEYNAAFPPGARWVLPYDPERSWDGSVWFGASLDSYERLGRRLGYRLVGCDGTGTNAFFVERRDAERVLREWLHGPARHYRPPAYGPAWFGHPPRRPPPAAPRALAAPELAAVRLAAGRLFSERPALAGELLLAGARLDNRSPVRLGSGGDHPLHVACRWLAGDGTVVVDEAERFPLPADVDPGGSRLVALAARPPAGHRRLLLRLTLVQEGVAWLDRDGREAFVDLPVTLADG